MTAIHAERVNSTNNSNNHHNNNNTNTDAR